MRFLFCVLLAVFGASASAQQGTQPLYPVSAGEVLRVHFATRPLNAPQASYLVGRVHSVYEDSLTLAVRPTGMQALAWSSIASIERRTENRTGELLGLIVGGIAGAMAGYVAGDLATDDPLGKAAFVPGALGGMFVGGLLGAHTGTPWAPVESFSSPGACWCGSDKNVTPRIHHRQLEVSFCQLGLAVMGISAPKRDVARPVALAPRT